jgi:hypothetical protein
MLGKLGNVENHAELSAAELVDIIGGDGHRAISAEFGPSQISQLHPPHIIYTWTIPRVVLTPVSPEQGVQ